MRFVDNVVVTAAGSGAIASQVYGIASPRVPERSTMTGVSQGWASCIAKFARYVCFGSRIRWQVTQLANATTLPTAVRMVLLPSNNAGAALTSISDADVQKYSKSFGFPPLQNAIEPSASPYNRWTGSHAMTVSKIEGEANLRSASYEAVVASDPTLLPTWNFYFQDLLAAATANPSFLFRVELFYDVLFFDRVMQVNALESSSPFARIRGPETKLGDAYETKVARDYTPVTPSTPVDARPPAGWTLVRKVASLK